MNHAAATSLSSYENLYQGLRAELKPQGTLQTELFERLVRVFWTLRTLDVREDQIFRESGLPLCAAQPKEFENSLRYRRFLAKEQRDLTAQLAQLQTEAAIRDIGDDFSGFERHSILVSLRPLVELHNLRCATPNNGQPKVVYSKSRPQPAPQPLKPQPLDPAV